ncbi:recombination and repair protein RecN [Gammaproteobacteria bacterium]|nr:recombination and repair protein RecN [Gammaproteobacteria bacterium]
MLTDLTIHNFAIIDELNLEFKQGLSVISGETGAGKSITVDALSIVLGGKADATCIRHGAEQCEISANFDISKIPNAQAWLAEQSILNEDNLCFIRRVISNTGRTRTFINGRAQPLQSVKELGELLLDIHGQHAHQSLVKKDQQRILLDQFALSTDLVKDLGKIAREIDQIQTKIHTLKSQSLDNTEKSEFLRFQLAEFEQLKPNSNEWEQISCEYDQLNKVESRLSLYQECALLLNDDEHGISALLSRLLSKLQSSSKKDASLADIIGMIDNALILCTEAQSDLNNKAEGADLDPERLATLEARMRSLSDLANKHRVAPEDLYEKQQKLQEELEGRFVSDEQLELLENTCLVLKDKWLKSAQVITQKRQKCVKKLNLAITAAMQGLAMEGGKFEILLIEQSDFHPFGAQSIDFYVSANPGQPLQPLGKVASGGELARISLAIAVILSMQSALPTLIFDEVDTGVGGAVAEMIGQHLQMLSVGRQVFCVTHLAQVACFGHQHYVAAKHKSKNNTQTQIHLLNGQDKINEIARMLGGMKLTDATFTHAQEMLKSAHESI